MMELLNQYHITKLFKLIDIYEKKELPVHFKMSLILIHI